MPSLNKSSTQLTVYSVLSSTANDTSRPIRTAILSPLTAFSISFVLVSLTMFFQSFRLGNVLLHGVETHSVCKRRDFKLAKLCSDFTAIHRRKSNVFESALDGNVAVDSDKLFAQKRKLFVVLNILSQFAGNIACVFQDAFKRAVFVQKLLRRFSPTPGIPGTLSDVSPLNAL